MFEVNAQGVGMGKARRQSPVPGTEAHRAREQLARKLFNDWTRATDREILGALWHNLSSDDRRYWFDLADEKLSEDPDAQ